MIEFVLSAIASGVVGNGAYDGIKAILAAYWVQLNTHKDNPAELQHALNDILESNVEVKAQLQQFCAQPEIKTQIENFKGVWINNGTVNQTIY